MLIISHRGNLYGDDPIRENTLEAALDAIRYGFFVELDIYWDNGFYLGHNAPMYPIEKGQVLELKNHCFFHVKNIEAIERLEELECNYFWHENDKMALTRNNEIWLYPSTQNTDCKHSKSIFCLPEKIDGFSGKGFYGICTDYPFAYRKS